MTEDALPSSSMSALRFKEATERNGKALNLLITVFKGSSTFRHTIGTLDEGAAGDRYSLFENQALKAGWEQNGRIIGKCDWIIY